MMNNAMRHVFSRQAGSAPTRRPYLRWFVTLWFVLLLVVGGLASVTAHTTDAVAPYTVTITSTNFRMPLVTLATDDISDAGNARFSLQNGTPLWYGITLTSTPSGIVPTAANPANDPVSATFLGTTPLLPPMQVFPFDQWNGSYHFETLKLKAAFSGPGQQLQLELNPIEPHAVTLDILTLLLQLLGQKQGNVQIGLLETGALQDVFAVLNDSKDFTALRQNYSQALTTPDAAAVLPHAYACAINITNLLSDASEQAALADVLWKVQGKAVAREAILKAIVDLAQTQFGLAVEGYINNVVGAMAGMFPQSGNPVVLLQTVSTVTPSVTPSQSPTDTPTHVSATPSAISKGV